MITFGIRHILFGRSNQHWPQCLTVRYFLNFDIVCLCVAAFAGVIRSRFFFFFNFIRRKRVNQVFGANSKTTKPNWMHPLVMFYFVCFWESVWLFSCILCLLRHDSKAKIKRKITKSNHITYSITHLIMSVAKCAWEQPKKKKISINFVSCFFYSLS